MYIVPGKHTGNTLGIPGTDNCVVSPWSLFSLSALTRKGKMPPKRSILLEHYNLMNGQNF